MMEEHKKAIGIIIGSFVGCILAGVFAYLRVPIVLICLVMVGSTWIGYNVGNRFKKVN